MNQEPVYRASTFKRETSPTAWNQALARFTTGHALQSWTWGQFKSRWGWQPIPLLLTIGESSWEPLAAAMILKRRVPRLPYSVLYVPRGPALDYNDSALRRVVLAELENIARRERAIFIKIDPEVVRSWGLEEERKSPVGAKFTAELRQRGWRFAADQPQFRNTVELDLTLSEEALLMGMHQKTRYNIRLAGRKGITIRAGEAGDFPLMGEMYAETAVRDQFTIRPLPYYYDAWQSMLDAGMGQLLIAEYDGEPVGAVFLVRFGRRAIYMYGASTQKERKRMPNYLLQWEAIRWAKAQGCAVYDFWGAPDQFVEADRMWGVWRFKKGFNGEVVRHIGAWDYAPRPLLYWFYSVVKPRYLNLLRRRSGGVNS